MLHVATRSTIPLSFWQRLLSGASILVAFQAEFVQALAELRSLEVTCERFFSSALLSNLGAGWIGKMFDVDFFLGSEKDSSSMKLTKNGCEDIEVTISGVFIL